MINGIGVLGWGVGGIEAEAGMLGQPIYILTPDVVGVHLKGNLQEGVTATDLVLTVTELLRKTKVVGKFVEYFGDGAASLSPTDRATVANMSPDYGATIGFFAVDDKTVEYFRVTGRDEEIDAIEAYCKAQGMYGIPKTGQSDYSQVVEIDLSTVVPTCRARSCRISASLSKASRTASELCCEARQPKAATKARRRSGQAHRDPKTRPRRRSRRRPDRRDHLVHQHVEPVRAARRRAARQESRRARPEAPSARQDLAGPGLQGRHRVPEKCRPAAVSRATRLLRRRLRLHHLHGSGGTARQGSEDTVVKNDLIGVAVLSGNRNFEARIHQA